MEQLLSAALRAVVLLHLTVLLAHSLLERRYARRPGGTSASAGRRTPDSAGAMASWWC